MIKKTLKLLLTTTILTLSLTAINYSHSTFAMNEANTTTGSSNVTNKIKTIEVNYEKIEKKINTIKTDIENIEADSNELMLENSEDKVNSKTEKITYEIFITLTSLSSKVSALIDLYTNSSMELDNILVNDLANKTNLKYLIKKSTELNEILMNITKKLKKLSEKYDPNNPTNPSLIFIDRENTVTEIKENFINRENTVTEIKENSPSSSNDSVKKITIPVPISVDEFKNCNAETTINKYESDWIEIKMPELITKEYLINHEDTSSLTVSFIEINDTEKRCSFKLKNIKNQLKENYSINIPINYIEPGTYKINVSGQDKPDRHYMYRIFSINNVKIDENKNITLSNNNSEFENIEYELKQLKNKHKPENITLIELMFIKLKFENLCKNLTKNKSMLENITKEDTKKIKDFDIEIKSLIEQVKKQFKEDPSKSNLEDKLTNIDSILKKIKLELEDIGRYKFSDSEKDKLTDIIKNILENFIKCRLDDIEATLKNITETEFKNIKNKTDMLYKQVKILYNKTIL